MKNRTVVNAHLSIFLSCLIWGLMSPIGKDAMNNGISGLDMVAFRVIGAGILFWLTSLFIPSVKVSNHDKLMIALAALCGLVCNQCCFTIGLSLTSPINSSIITTTLPIVTMLLAALILHEPVTFKKVIGILCGASGALILVLGSISAASAKEGNLKGDLLCVISQFSFGFYLCIFKKLMKKYDVVTFQKWMFLFGSIMVIPLSFHSLSLLSWNTITVKTWLETAFVVVAATYFAYIFNMIGQRILRPTVISMYNYVQPIAACIVSVMAGLAIFGWKQSIAIFFVFIGVYLVTKSKSHHDLEKEAKTDK